MQLHRRTFTLALALTLLGGASSCGSSGGDGAPPAGPSGDPLNGTWYGTEEQSNGTLVALEVRVSELQITSIRVDNASTGLTGSISQVPGRPNFYAIVLSDGTEGGFFVDSSKTYVVFVDEEFNFGVLQKGATTLPNAASNAIYGRNYAGVTVLVDGNLEITDVFTSNVEVFSDGNFSGSDSSGTTFSSISPLTQMSSTYGAWQTFYESNGPAGFESGPVRAFTSPDRRFIGTWACESGGFFPTDCSFSVWTAQ